MGYSISNFLYPENMIFLLRYNILDKRIHVNKRKELRKIEKDRIH